jgi:hypothetical protein
MKSLPNRPREQIKLFGSEAQVLKKLEHRFKSGCNQETAAYRKLTDEEFEDCGLGLATIQICLKHVKLIEVCKQRARRKVHAATFARSQARAHRDRLKSEFGSYFTWNC